MSPSMLSTPDDTSANWLPTASGEMPCSRLAILCWSNLTLTRIPSTMTCTPMLVCSVGIGCSISRCCPHARPLAVLRQAAVRLRLCPRKQDSFCAYVSLCMHLGPPGHMCLAADAAQASLVSPARQELSAVHLTACIVTCTHVKQLCQLERRPVTSRSAPCQASAEVCQIHHAPNPVILHLRCQPQIVVYLHTTHAADTAKSCHHAGLHDGQVVSDKETTCLHIALHSIDNIIQAYKILQNRSRRSSMCFCELRSDSPPLLLSMHSSYSKMPCDL